MRVSKGKASFLRRYLLKNYICYAISLYHSNTFSDMNKIDIRFTTLCLFLFVAAFSRIIPHMPNFSPLAAIGMFGAAHFSRKWLALFMPILATWLSDLFINNVIYGSYQTSFTWFYEGFYWQYGSYILIAVMALFVFKKISIPRVLGMSLMATVLFFLISNLGSWFSLPQLYSRDFNGIMACYVAGIPFIKGTLYSDLVYSIILFGTYYLLQKKFSVLKPAHIQYV